MGPLNLISEALTLITDPGRQALKLDSLHPFPVSDELHRMAWRGDLVLAYGPRSDTNETLQMERALKSPTSIPVRKGANFFLECLAPLPSVMRGDEKTPGLPKISDEPGCENEGNGKQKKEMLRVLGTVSGCQGNIQ